ncbi:hypothetical protein EDB85DRAFT_2278623 [Lactarius pseudohatsudake]|nr:hypothetical protein EDB85DRAFT_2278623 [Lactarius pseudohatsudake]
MPPGFPRTGRLVLFPLRQVGGAVRDLEMGPPHLRGSRTGAPRVRCWLAWAAVTVIILLAFFERWLGLIPGPHTRVVGAAISTVWICEGGTRREKQNMVPSWQPKNRLSTTRLTSSALCGLSTNPSTRPTEVLPFFSEALTSQGDNVFLAAIEARLNIAGKRHKRGARQRRSTFSLNAQKARETPCEHSWPAGQAGRLYAIRQRELFLPAVLHPSPSVARKPEPLTVSLTTEDAEAFAAATAADVVLLLSSADESRAFLPPDRTASTTGARNTGNDAESASAPLQHNTALQKELAARCGGTRRRWCGLRVHDHRSEGARDDVSERYRASSNVVAIAFLVMFFCHSVHMRSSGRRPLAS